MNEHANYMYLMICGAMLLIFLATAFLVINFSTKITSPIKKLTEFTGILTSATDFKEKQQRII